MLKGISMQVAVLQRIVAIGNSMETREKGEARSKVIKLMQMVVVMHRGTQLVVTRVDIECRRQPL